MIARGLSGAFSDRADVYRERIERRLEAAIRSDNEVPASLREAMAYSVLGGGKRVRPLLCYASGELCGLDPTVVDPIATAIELVHAYSLIHDDLPAMDDDDLRRGRPTTHRKFDEATAILAGDALQALAFEVLTRDPALTDNPAAQTRAVAGLARASGPAGMVGGQQLDLEAEGQQLDESGLEAIHRRKTGQLIRAAIVIPGEFASLDAGARSALDLFASEIGLVFQIRDDLLEIEQDTATLGKNAGSDEARNKSTSPSVPGPDGARQRADSLYAQAIAALDSIAGDSDGLKWVSDFILKRVY